MTANLVKQRTTLDFKFHIAVLCGPLSQNFFLQIKKILTAIYIFIDFKIIGFYGASIHPVIMRMPEKATSSSAEEKTSFRYMRI